MKIEKNLTLLLILLLFSSTSILITNISLSTLVYAQQNQTETKNQIPEAAKGPAIPSK
jgi:hypothetical protein